MSHRLLTVNSETVAYGFLIFPGYIDYITCLSFVRDGNLLDIVNSGSLHEFLANLHERYGPVVSFWFGRRLVVSLGSIDVLKQHFNPNKARKSHFFFLLSLPLPLRTKCL